MALTAGVSPYPVHGIPRLKRRALEIIAAELDLIAVLLLVFLMVEASGTETPPPEGRRVHSFPSSPSDLPLDLTAPQNMLLYAILGVASAPQLRVEPSSSLSLSLEGRLRLSSPQSRHRG